MDRRAKLGALKKVGSNKFFNFFKPSPEQEAKEGAKKDETEDEKKRRLEREKEKRELDQYMPKD